MAFLERQYAGSPHQAGITDEQVFSSSPLSERTVQDIQFGNDVFTPPRTIRWVGTINFPQTGVYRWNFNVIGGIRLSLDGVSVLDRWTNVGYLSPQVETTVQAGNHTLVVDYTIPSGTSRVQMFQNFVRATTPTTPPTIPTNPSGSVPPPPPPPSTGTPQIDLATIVQFSRNSIDRSYAKRSLVPPASEMLNIQNTSNDIDLNVTFNSVPSVVFNPATFALPKQTSRAVTISFVPSVLETYENGMTTVNATVALTALNTPTTPLTPTSSITPPPNVPPTHPIMITPQFITMRVDHAPRVLTATRNGVPVAVNWQIWPISANQNARFENAPLMPYTNMTVLQYSSVTLVPLRPGSFSVAAILGSEGSQAPITITPGVIRVDIDPLTPPIEPPIIVVEPEIPSIPGPVYTGSIPIPPVTPPIGPIMPPPPEPILGGGGSNNLPDVPNPDIAITNLDIL